ncbi:BRO family protein [Brevibacillus agri]|uniref:BRO-N domain-containing protein n=1 Tax=Brevibacillus agri TaxID=51101 RepID=UPI0025B665ED|nr:BRO family protein [Brevibacillus agri]MDN4093557.1 BRO family protein [Brevibacillus agri]
MNQLQQIFTYEGQDVRVVMVGDEPHWVAKDVCDILDIGNITDAMKRLDEDEFDSIEVIDSLGRKQKMKCVNESGLYELIFGSRKPEAKAFKKWVKQVLKEIRANGVYISPVATEQQIDNAVRFATPQRRRKVLMEATIDGKDSVFNVYEALKDYIKRKPADEKITIYEHVELVLKDKQATYGNDVAFVHKIEELLRQVAKDLDKLKNWQNGAKKRELSKENKQLKQMVEELTPPSIEDYFCIPYHPFSENRQYKPLTENKWVKTPEYKQWCDYFPYYLMPSEEELGIDWNKPIKMYLAYDHIKKFDVSNFHKSAIDMIFKFYGQDDNIINEIQFVNKTNRYVNTYRDGKIYFLLVNVE